ncbi:hypothetical protein [Endozoicomonas numazuensis]|nr:hypothetical protein [Endozoicomonas numazuensis]
MIDECLAKGKDPSVIRSLFNTMTEPEKETMCFTGVNDLDSWLLERMHYYASIHSIDSLFNATRRSLSYLERPISKESNSGKVWAGKNPYNPNMIEKVLDIQRACNNFIKISPKDNKTPAMRLARIFHKGAATSGQVIQL